MRFIKVAWVAPACVISVLALCSGYGHTQEKPEEAKGEQTAAIPVPAQKERAAAQGAANAALDQLVTLEHEGASLHEVLKWMADRGVQYVISREVLDAEGEVLIRVKDVPLREVLQMVARSAGMKSAFSTSGIATLYPDPAQAESRRMQAQQRMLQRFRDFGGRPDMGMFRRQRQPDGDGDAPDQRRRPRQGRDRAREREPRTQNPALPEGGADDREGVF